MCAALQTSWRRRAMRSSQQRRRALVALHSPSTLLARVSDEACAKTSGGCVCLPCTSSASVLQAIGRGMEHGDVHLLRYTVDAIRKRQHLRLQQLPPRTKSDEYVFQMQWSHALAPPSVGCSLVRRGVLHVTVVVVVVSAEGNKDGFPLVRVSFLLRGMMSSCGVTTSMILEWHPMARKELQRANQRCVNNNTHCLCILASWPLRLRACVCVCNE